MHEELEKKTKWDANGGAGSEQGGAESKKRETGLQTWSRHVWA